MRIVHVSPYFNFPSEGPVGGVLLYVYELSRALAERGHEVTIYTSGNILENHRVRTAQKTLEHREGIEVRRFPCFDNLSLPCLFPRLENPLPFPSFMSSLSKENDVIHIHGHEYAISFVASLVTKKCKMPTVLTMHNIGEALEEFCAIYMLRRILNRTFFAFTVDSARAVIAKSKRDLYTLKKFRPRRIKMIPLGIDLKRFESLGGESKYVLFLGRLEHTKRPEDFVRAIPLILEKVETDFVIAGTGVQYAYLQSLVQKLRIDRYVKFIGWVSYERVPAVIAGASVIVAPGDAGYSIMEAAAARKPIVSARLDGNIGAIGEKSALFTEYGNIKELAEAVSRVLTDRKLAESLAEKAYPYIKSNRSWDALVGNILAVYKEALKE